MLNFAYFKVYRLSDSKTKNLKSSPYLPEVSLIVPNFTISVYGSSCNYLFLCTAVHSVPPILSSVSIVSL